MKTIYWHTAIQKLHDMIDDMDGNDMEHMLAAAFPVKNVNYNSETDHIEFDPDEEFYAGELDET